MSDDLRLYFFECGSLKTRVRNHKAARASFPHHPWWGPCAHQLWVDDDAL